MMTMMMSVQLSTTTKLTISHTTHVVESVFKTSSYVRKHLAMYLFSV